MIRLVVMATSLALAACTTPDDVPDPIAPRLDLPNVSPIQSGISLRLTGVSRWEFEKLSFVAMEGPKGKTSTNTRIKGEAKLTAINDSQRFQLRVTDLVVTASDPEKAPDTFSLNLAAPGAVLLSDFDTLGRHVSVRLEPPHALPDFDAESAAETLKAALAAGLGRRPLVRTAHQGDVVFRLPATKMLALSGVRLIDQDAEIEQIAAGELERYGKQLVLLSFRLRPKPVWTARAGFGYIKAACGGYELLDPDSGWSFESEFRCQFDGKSIGRSVSGTIRMRTSSKPIDSNSRGQQSVGKSSEETRSSRAGSRPPPGSDTMSIPFAASWDGVDDILLGTLTVAGTKNSGRLEVSAGQLDCSGQWQWVGGKYGTGDLPHGTWTLACNNGKAAAGTYRSRERGKGTGTGIDNDQSAVRVTFGKN